MKKINLILALTSLMLITSCSSITTSSDVISNGDSSDIIIDSTSDSSSITLATDFTSEEISLMKVHLNGETLPFDKNMSGLYNLYYDSEYDCISISFDSSLATSSFLDEYANIFISLDKYTQSDTSLYENYYQFLIEYSNDYLLQIDLYITTSNELCLDAYYYNPYIYNWPSDYINDFATTLGVTLNVPEYKASKYEVDYYTDYGYLYIYCYLDSSLTGDDAISSYKSTLEGAGYTVTYEEDYEDYETTLTTNINLYYGYDEDTHSLWILIDGSNSLIS